MCNNVTMQPMSFDAVESNISDTNDYSFLSFKVQSRRPIKRRMQDDIQLPAKKIKRSVPHASFFVDNKITNNDSIIKPEFSNTIKSTCDNCLVPIDDLCITSFRASPIIKALSAYDSVLLKDLLVSIDYDNDNETVRSESAKQIMEYFKASAKLVSKSNFEQFMQLGTGANCIKLVSPFFNQFCRIIKILSYKHSNETTGSVMEKLLTHAKKNPGTESHEFVSNLMNAQTKCQLSNPKQLTEHSDRVSYKTPSLSESNGQKKSDSKQFIWNKISSFLAGLAFASPVSAEKPSDSDIKTTDTLPVANGTTCSPTQFPCLLGGKCISHSQVCDKNYDCGLHDISDESPANCNHYCEHTDRFLCKTISQCVLKKLVCNKRFDCLDGSDEQSPPCPCIAGYTLCNDGTKCIPNDMVCNSYEDCKDGSDELISLCQRRFVNFINEEAKDKPQSYIDKLKQITCDDYEPNKLDDIGRYGFKNLDCNTSFAMSQDKCESLCRNRNAGRSKVLWCPRLDRPTGRCVKSSEICDGRPICADGIDELDHVCFYKCRTFEFPCEARGACLDQSKLCNGVRDCPNGRDENEYTCIKENLRIKKDTTCIDLKPDRLNSCYTGLKQASCQAAKQLKELTTAMDTTTTPDTTTSVSSTTESNVTNSNNRTSIVNTTGASASLPLAASFAVAGGVACALLGATAGAIVLYKKLKYRHTFPNGLDIDSSHDQSILLHNINQESTSTLTGIGSDNSLVSSNISTV